MPFNGSGTYAPPDPPVFPAIPGTIISSAYYNQLILDIGNALSDCMTLDGQSQPAANLPMNSKKFTGLAPGTGAGDSVEYGQLVTVLTAAGTPVNGVANIAALQALTTLTFANTAVYTECGVTVGDGLGRMYVYKSGDSTTADNGSTVLVDASARRWYAVAAGGATNTTSGSFTLLPGALGQCVGVNGSGAVVCTLPEKTTYPAPQIVPGWSCVVAEAHATGSLTFAVTGSDVILNSANLKPLTQGLAAIVQLLAEDGSTHARTWLVLPIGIPANTGTKRPMWSYRMSANQTSGTALTTPLAFDTANFAAQGGASFSGGLVTVPTTGIYEISFSVGVYNTSGGLTPYNVALLKNGATLLFQLQYSALANFTSYTGAATVLLSLTAGDQVGLYYGFNLSVDLSIVGGAGLTSHFSGQLIS